MARAVEEESSKLATSKQMYDGLIQKYISSVQETPLVGDALQTAQLEDDISQIVSTGISIGRYSNANHFKDGLFSTVYKARSLEHSLSGKSTWRTGLVALKVTQLANETDPHNSRREARILARSASQSVMPLFDKFEVRGGNYALVMPFMPVELGQILRKGPLDPSRAKSILQDLMSALDHVHGLGIIHRDVKPSNILLQSFNGRAVLADFGISWWGEDSASEPATLKCLDVGTTCYRSPELLFGNQKYDSSLDMWAAGCVAAEILSLGSKTLFDSGDLGSDLALVKSIFETLGTPNLDVWPEADEFPDWGKMHFHEYPGEKWEDTLPTATAAGLDFVSRLVRYESRDRLSASHALQHELLAP